MVSARQAVVAGMIGRCRLARCDSEWTDVDGPEPGRKVRSLKGSWYSNEAESRAASGLYRLVLATLLAEAHMIRCGGDTGRTLRCRSRVDPVTNRSGRPLSNPAFVSHNQFRDAAYHGAEVLRCTLFVDGGDHPLYLSRRLGGFGRSPSPPQARSSKSSEALIRRTARSALDCVRAGFVLALPVVGTRQESSLTEAARWAVHGGDGFAIDPAVGGG